MQSLLKLAAWAAGLGFIAMLYQGEARKQLILLSIGILVGFANSWLASIRLSAAAWPVYETVIDWNKAAELESANEVAG